VILKKILKNFLKKGKKDGKIEDIKEGLPYQTRRVRGEKTRKIERAAIP
jgi:hypothetical protein